MEQELQQIEEINQPTARCLATIQRVISIHPIEGADNIEVIKVLGWYLVTKKGEFSQNQLCCFFEVDAILPAIPIFAFMEPRKFRVKTSKFRGQISQGLAMRLDEVLPNFGSIVGDLFRPNGPYSKPQFKTSIKLEEGADLTDAIGVLKYDPEGESLIAGTNLRIAKPQFKHKYWIVSKFRQYRYYGMRWFYKSKLAKALKLDDPLAKIGFPEFVPKTDETRVQNLGTMLSINAGTDCYTSEKCEGQSLTTYRLRKKFGICSRNLDVSKDKNSNWVKMAEKYKLLDILAAADKDYALQAEIIGPGVQGNIYELKELEIRMFYIYDIQAKRKLNYDDFVAKCTEWNLPMVPILNENYILPADVDSVVALADGKSIINPKVLREGIVIVNKWANYQGQYFSLKAISPSYEMKKDEAADKARKKKEAQEAAQAAYKAQDLQAPGEAMI